MALRFVHIEDDPIDRELVANVLREEGVVCTIQAVATREALEAALTKAPDLILADMSLPGFDGMTAQQIARERHPDVPFVFVSGSMGEENAVELLRSGATDYVLKHRLERLPTAVKRALREADDRRVRSHAEEALRELNAELETRVQERTRALKDANDALLIARKEADRANAAKSAFLSRMSHDLRTPLNAILGFAQLLEMDLPAEQQASVGQILSAGRHLLELINEVLDIARIEAGQLSLSVEPVRIADAVQQAVELVRPLADSRGITLEFDPTPPLFVYADRQRLTQVLLNLLSNAVKYNREHGRIIVSVFGDRSSSMVGVIVRDTGAGIPPEKLALLFTPFERLGAERSAVEGTGLGLALAKSMTELMGGTIAVESVVDQGTAFRIELKRCDELDERHQVGSTTPARSEESLGTLLYVEDNLSNVWLMERLISHRPRVRFMHAGTGAAALALIEHERPQLILLDLHLPDMGGDEVLRKLWNTPATRGIPVVILTADATNQRRSWLLASGATEYLTKPFDVGDVLRIIDRHLRPGPASMDLRLS
jgi:signal transduction histidine kinase